MKNKKIVAIFTIAFMIVIVGGYFAIKYIKTNNAKLEELGEYTPQEEIAEEQVRQTIVSLYFPSKETKELVPEARLIDIKEIINNPYEKLMMLLIEGPKNEKCESVIPKDTKVLKTYMEDDCVVLDLTEEFLDFDKQDEKVKSNIINSIVNTLTELTEVNRIKILINGETNEEFNEVVTRDRDF